MFLKDPWFRLLCSSGLIAASLLAPEAAWTQSRGWSVDPEEARVFRDSSTEAVCVEYTPHLTPPDSLGPVKNGMTVSDIQSVCQELEYGWLVWERGANPVLLSRFGELTVLIEVSDTLPSSSFFRMSSMSPAARTPTGIGPGLTIQEVASIWQKPLFGFGEGNFVASEYLHSNLSLLLTIPKEPEWDRIAWIERGYDWRELPEEVSVESVLLHFPRLSRGPNDS